MKEANPTTEKEVLASEVIEQTATKSELDNAILHQIREYYQKGNLKNNRLEENETDSTKEMVYYNIPEEEGGYSFAQMSVSIPKKMSSSSILTGDLNNDDREDLVVIVSTQGGGGGGNVWWDDIFVFLKNGDNYQLTTTQTNWEVIECNGYVGISKIENNKLIGASFCYKKGDPRCCPSLKSNVKLKLEGGKLVESK